MSELATAFAAFGPAYRRWMESRARDEGLTFARMRLLHVLGHHGPSIMRELGDQLSVTPRGVTNLVDGLERDGLVRRCPHPTDRRATIVELTPEGESSAHRRLECYASQSAELFTHLAEHDQRELLRIVRDLTAILDRLSARE